MYKDKELFYPIEPVILDLLKKFPVNKWLDINNLINHINFNFIDINPVDKDFARKELYFNIRYRLSWGGGTERLYIDKYSYNSSVKTPYLKASMFLFAAFGLLDIAYDTPNTENFGDSCKSPYDALQYVRLNSLGAYILGKIQEYELPETITNQSINLSEDSLTIIINKDDITAPVILEPFAYRVSPNRYRSDFSYFLTGITSKTDLDAKIDLFKQSIRIKDMPEVWKNFFIELHHKLDPLIMIEDVYIFQIPDDNKDLLNLVVKDPVIRSLSQKAEGHQILVPQKNLNRFKKRLQEFGYLMIN